MCLLKSLSLLTVVEAEKLCNLAKENKTRFDGGAFIANIICFFRA